MVGTCKGCGAENVEVNEGGWCATCAAAAAATPAAPSTEGTDAPMA